MKYDHKAIEKKWQKHWEEKKTFKTSVDANKPKYYILDMFPYPSGAGLHVGHVVGYTATDIIARYRRMKGFNVLHPMGWDSFGLPAEQYAVRTGTHPRITTHANIATYRRQLKSLGFSYDWDREIATSDPTYYKWTQWIFTKLYEKGLAYEAEVSVNYCPFLGTVLANEEVDGDKSKEGGHPVIKKPLRQWMFKITAYADRLLEDLDTLDWPAGIKALQANWIGRSEGALIDFQVEGSQEKISVFTTCPHTLFGVTYLSLAPEHRLVDTITLPSHKAEVEAYRKKVACETEIERTELEREKTGVFLGVYALCPATNKKIPIWIADYVLPSYGTGSVMAVPSHDERDFIFAKKYALELVPVVLPHNSDIAKQVAAKEICFDKEGTLHSSEGSGLTLNGLSVAAAKERVIDWLEAEQRGQRKVQYKLRDWLFSRQRYWGEPIPILHFEDGTKRALDIDELPLLPPEISDYKPSGDGLSPLSKVTEWVEIVDPKTGKKAKRETNTMPQWAGSCWYYLRFADPSNQNVAWDKGIENYWQPVDMYVGGAEHAVLHLLYARFWHKVLFDLQLVSTAEPFKSLRNQGLIVSRSYKTKNNVYIAAEEVEERNGKYFHKITSEELQSQIDKMSKSKLNGVTPDEIIEEYGADALRLYEMFMGPLDKEKVWNTNAVHGCHRFLVRAYDLFDESTMVDEESPEAMKLIHKLIAGATKDMQELQFNTVVAKMMEFMNSFSQLKQYPKQALVYFAQILAPLAPHIAEEMWQKLGNKESISFSNYPVADPEYLIDQQVIYVVQVNGKLRGRLECDRAETEEAVLQKAKELENVVKFLEGKTIIKTVFVPEKLISFVIN